MVVTRRSFLAAGGALAAGALAPGSLLAAIARSAPKRAGRAPDLSSWSDVRGLFNLAPGWTHLSAFYLASHPRPVREAVDQYRRALDDNPYLYVEQSMFQDDHASLELATRTAAAAYMGGRAGEVAIVPNTTSGLGLVYAGLPLKAGDEVLCTTHDHYSHHEAIRLNAGRARASTRRIALYDRGAEADRDEIVRRVRREVRPRTRVLGITWVHSCTGVRLPVRAIADVVAQINRGRPSGNRLLLVVDGVHGLGCSDELESQLGADFFCAGTHKWIFAPRGTGIVWAPEANWAMLRPAIATFSDLDCFRSWIAGKAPPAVTAAQMTPGGFHAYEHVWAMMAAFELHAKMKRPRVAARIRELNARCRAGLARMRHVTLHTPSDPQLSAGLQCFEVRSQTAEETARKLIARKIVASSSPYAPSYARMAPSLVNDEADVDRGLAAVAEIAKT